MATRDWWEAERCHFRLVASAITEQELSAGDYPNQQACRRLIRRLSYVPVTKVVRRLAAAFLDDGVVPDTKPGDAAQLAIATPHELDYLLTWNYAHLANPAAQLRGRRLAEKHGLKMPWLVSPEAIPQIRLGQDTWRPKHE
jgi:hypothetical protein